MSGQCQEQVAVTRGFLTDLCVVVDGRDLGFTHHCGQHVCAFLAKMGSRAVLVLCGMERCFLTRSNVYRIKKGVADQWRTSGGAAADERREDCDTDCDTVAVRRCVCSIGILMYVSVFIGSGVAVCAVCGAVRCAHAAVSLAGQWSKVLTLT